LNPPFDASTNEWWQKLTKIVELKKTRNVTSIFGNNITHHAHKADIIRLEALLIYGGIYLDIDVFPLKSFDSLLGERMVLGFEQTSEGKYPHGLGNAVILANNHSEFLRIWYAQYRNFNYTQWATHSIHLPLRLYNNGHQHLVHVLPSNAFYYPSWDEIGHRLLYFSNTYDLTHNYAVHAWKSDSQIITSIEMICCMQTTYGRLLRMALLSEHPHNCDLFISPVPKQPELLPQNFTIRNKK
jgi:hypothetical protein